MAEVTGVVDSGERARVGMDGPGEHAHLGLVHGVHGDDGRNELEAVDGSVGVKERSMGYGEILDVEGDVLAEAKCGEFDKCAIGFQAENLKPEIAVGADSTVDKEVDSE